MKSTLSLLYFCFLFSCGDQKTPLPPSIEGHWRQLIPVHPPTEYDFRNGIMVQTISAAGQQVAAIERPYAERGDTVLIGGNTNDPQRTWVVRLLGDGAMEASQISADAGGLGGYYILERQ